MLDNGNAVEPNTLEIPFLHRFALLIACLAFLVYALGGLRRTAREADTPRYERIANNMLHHGVISSCKQPPFLPEIIRMPGYPVFLAAIKVIAGEGDYKIVCAQSLLHGLTTLALFWLAFALSGNLRFGLITELGWAFYPYAFYYATSLLSETLSAASLTLGITGLVVYLRTKKYGWLALSCVGFVAAAYTRPNLWLIPPFLLFLALCFKSVRNRFTVRTLGAVCLALAICLATWAARNYAAFGRILIGSYNYWGNNLCQSSVQFRFSLAEIWNYCGPTDELTTDWLNECDWRRNLAADEEFRKRAFDQIREHPLSFSIYTLERPFRIWLSFNLDNRPQTPGVRIVQIAAGTVTLALFPLFVLGLYLLTTRTPHGWVLAATCAAVSATHLIVVAAGRYSMPARPLYILTVLYGAWRLWTNRRAVFAAKWRAIYTRGVK